MLLTRSLVVSVALLPMLAGCLTTSQTPLEPSGLPGALPLDVDRVLALDHDHGDPALHEATSSSIHPMAHLSWPSLLLDAYPAQQYGELDVVDGLAFVAALLSGFAIVDLADPAAPRTLSFTPILPVYVADIKAAEGGDLAILGTQRTISRWTSMLGLPPVPPAVQVPSAAPIGAIGLQAWDTTDKAAPRLAGYTYVDGGCHMVSVRAYEGGTHVFCAPNDNTVRVFRVVHAGPAVLFEPVAVWAPGDLSEVVDYKVNPLRAQFTHDMTVQEDPLTGEPVMLVSFWDRGVWVVDVKDPSSPQVLGSWAGEDALLWDGRIHTAMAALVDGTRVVVTIPEYANIPAVFVLDATDYAAMRLRSEWQPRPDGDYGERPALFSTHNFQVVDGKVYIAMYHGGVWVLDIRDLSAPRVLGHFLPAGSADFPAAPGKGPVPETWDVVVADGYVVALDIPTGLYVLHLDGDPRGDPAYDSFA